MAAVDGNAVVDEGRKYLGDKYVYGAEGPSTFDCSGLVQYVFGRFGVKLPRTSEQQWRAGKAVALKDLKPGDLVFSEMGSGGPGHVGIFAGPHNFGDGRGVVPVVLEAPHTGDVVKYLPLTQFGAVGYRRVTGVTPGTQDTGEAGAVEGAAGGGLLSFPGEITGFFRTAYDDLSSTADFFTAFFQPSTYVRMGAGLLGTIFVGAGLLFLMREGAAG